MNLGFSDQNAKLKAAASQRVDTSPRVGQATEISARVSSFHASGDNSIDLTPEEAQVADVQPRIPSDPVRGSYEGYMRSSGAYIQPNKSGYDNPKLHNKRYTKNLSKANFLNIKNVSGNKINTSAIINNQSKSFKKDSSSDRLKNINIVERML